MSPRIPTLAATVAAIAFAAIAPAAGAYVTEQQAQASAEAAVGWFETQQDATGALGGPFGFGGDWAMIALAGTGVNAADVQTSPADPSVQDFYYDSWTGFGPGDLATDQARAILAGEAGGMQTAKLSASRNVVAKLASLFDGDQLGSTALVNDDIFGLLALDHAGAVAAISPSLTRVVRAAQTTKTSGAAGWGFANTADQDPDVDMTGAGIAALCAAGADASDPAVAKAIDWLATKQDDGNGGIVSSFFGANADSTAWVVNGLRQCGVDPQGPDWTTSTGKTPLDFLLTLQQPSGATVWVPGDTQENLYATQNAVTALVGDGFGATPPEREDPAEPAVRPAPSVADGTSVPLTLVLDHGTAHPGAERACSVTAPLGSTVAEMLQAAAATTTAPAYCVSALRIEGSGEGASIAGVNGVSPAAGAKWEVSVDGGAARTQLTDEVGLGSTVVVALDGAAAGGEPSLPPLTKPDARSATAKVALSRRQRLKVGPRGGLRLAVRCPRGLGASGCQGVLRVKYRARKGRYVTAGSRTFVVRSGKRRSVKVQLGAKLRRLAAQPGGRRVRIEAIVRDPSSGAIAKTRVTALVKR
jgi:hypothetical protein